MHPGLGPAAEADALYVRQLRLAERLQVQTGEFVIWDVGLGAAANALTVLRATRDTTATVRLISFDDSTEPLQFALRHADEMGYFKGYEANVRRLLAEGHAAWRNREQTVAWELHLADFPARLRAPEAGRLPKPHAILFDPYSPARNPAMWTLPLFTELFRLLDPARPCALATYSRSTMLRVTLLVAGFHVGRGRATGRKEETTVAANVPGLVEEPLDRSWLERARRSRSAEPLVTPVYRQAPLTGESWERLRSHPQFGGAHSTKSQ
jgi:tRNA U34 5-methylaminomethyl-2-thiouridine-forming methyltransferase MnmC